MTEITALDTLSRLIDFDFLCRIQYMKIEYENQIISAQKLATPFVVVFEKVFSYVRNIFELQKAPLVFCNGSCRDMLRIAFRVSKLV